MFGFSDPTVKMLIQELPNARLCKGYQWKEFESETSLLTPSSPIADTTAATVSAIER